MVEEIALTLNSPITDEQWDAITDVDFEHTNRIWFHTKHGKDVEFVKRKKGKWILSEDRCWKTCSECGVEVDVSLGLGIFVDDIGVDEMNFCPNCGVEMKED